MKSKMIIAVFGVCLLAASSSAAWATSTVQNQHGEEFEVQEEAVKVSNEEEDAAQESDYEPYTIVLNLERSGIGQNMEETFTKAPTHVVAGGDQMTDMFFDLGLEDNLAGIVTGSAHSLVSVYPAKENVEQLAEPGVNLKNVSKEVVIDKGCDFMMGWDSVFSEDAFSVSFCLDNGIIPYFPYVCSDKATFEDLYKDYETLGHIFAVTDVAEERIQDMKDTLARVEETLGEEVYANPVSVFVYDSGEEAPFTACQGIPGDIIKKAGGISSFDDIEKGWATPSWEEVVERDPDAILILDYTGGSEVEEKIEFLKSNPATKDMRAVQEEKFYSACCADMQGSAGSAGTVEIIARQLYPDKF